MDTDKGWSSSGSSAGSPSEFSSELSPISSTGSPPGVTMEELPFYTVCAEIVKPTRLVPKRSFISKKTKLAFVASSRTFDKILSSRKVELMSKDFTKLQLQFRMCLWNTHHPQMDCFPPGLRIRVNWQSLEGVGTESNCSARPLNITHLAHLSDWVANKILISWSPNEKRDFAGAVYLVMKLTVDDLLEKLWDDSVLPADNTRALIQEKLGGDSGEPSTSSLHVSLMCPLGQSRVTVPCRALSCSHLEIFDAIQYLKKNEEEETWMCPVCDTCAPFSKLVVDRYFVDILNGNTSCEEVEIHQDGSWSPMPSERNLMYYSNKNSKELKEEVASFSLIKSSSSKGEREYEHTPKRPCPATKTAIPTVTTSAVCSPVIEPSISLWGDWGVEVKKENEGATDLHPWLPAPLLPSLSASAMEQELPVTVQRPDQAQDVQTKNRGSPDSGSLIPQVANYTQGKKSLFSDCFKQYQDSSHLTSPKASPSHFSFKLSDQNPEPHSHWLLVPMPIESTYHKWIPPFRFDFEEEEDSDMPLALGNLTPKAQLTPPVGPMGDTVGRADPGTGTFPPQASQASSSRASSSLFSRVQQSPVPEASSASSSVVSQPWFTSAHWTLVNQQGKVFSMKPKQGWASSTQVRGVSSTRVTEAFFSRAREASSSRPGEASSSRPGEVSFSGAREASTSGGREAASSGANEPFFSRMRGVSSSLVSEASSPRAREALFSSGREASSSRASEVFSSRASEVSFPGVREVSSSRASEAFFTRATEASSSRGSEAFSSWTREAFTWASETFSSRASEAFSSRASEAFSFRVSEASTSRASEASTSRASEASTSRASEASTSRASEPFSSRASEAFSFRVSGPSFSRVSEASTSRESEPSSSRVSEPSSSRASEPSFSRASELSFSRASEASFPRSSEASFTGARAASSSRVRAASSSRAIGGQSMQAGGAASVLDSDESESQGIP
ncbi:uncharacterized protein LOC119919554 [Tachyglossus aculeatus]|uniref:uncharacterized protein LOC119919554 n=1 Tax=Tachyglossus aculeatus TaxID=9261 RepID=UPI0018F29764|nr:uncharacterized protein LOC119919554 [Tachyglossus aculeatus]